MKTKPSFLQMIAFVLGTLGTLLTTQPLKAQYQKGNGTIGSNSTTASAAPAFAASLFPSLHPLVLKVVFVNPARTSLMLLVKNEYQEVIYQKPLGNVKSYNSSVHLSGLVDGKYSMEITGKSAYYVKEFRVETEISRLAQIR